MKWPVVLIGAVLILGVLVFAFAYGTPDSSGTATSTTTSTPEILTGTPSTSYVDAERGFSIAYPQTVNVQKEGFEGFFSVATRALAGFSLPQDLFTGTNLAEAGVFIGISDEENIMTKCLSAAQGEEDRGTKMINGAVFYVFSSVDAAAGNTYSKTSYRIVRNGECLELVELLHSGNLGNYPVGTVKQYNEDLFSALLGKMLNTLSFASAGKSGVQGKVTILCDIPAGDPMCLPQERVLEAYQGISSVALFKTLPNGEFHFELSPGQYELRVDTASSTHCASVGVVVTENSFVSTRISCKVGGQE